MSMVTNGLTLAIIAGVPLGVLVGESFGWRATFLSVAGLATLSLLGTLVGMPSQPPVSTAGLGERWALAKRPDMMAILATSVLTVSATFTLCIRTWASSSQMSPGSDLRAWLWCYSASESPARPVPGSGGTAADHWGADHAVIVGGGLTVLAYPVLSLGAALEPARAMLVILPAIPLWGLASWGLMTAQQARLVALSPALAAVSLSLNSSAIYLRQRYRRGHWRAGHRPWRSGLARLGGGGVRRGRTAVGAG